MNRRIEKLNVKLFFEYDGIFLLRRRGARLLDEVERSGARRGQTARAWPRAAQHRKYFLTNTISDYSIIKLIGFNDTISCSRLFQHSRELSLCLFC